MQQPWMPNSPTPRPGVPDDFSRSSAVMSVRRAWVVLGVAWLLLLMGRSEAILDAAYGLPILPGTEAVIFVAEAWNDLLVRVGVPGVLRDLRALLSLGR